MDYRFAIRCWQDQAGDENAKANIFVNDTQVATEVEITATEEASAQVVSFEATGLPAGNDDGSVTCNVKIVLVNNYYVDASTDRNIWINGIAYLPKNLNGVYKGAISNPLTDFANFNEYNPPFYLPTSVVGDQLPDDFWDAAIAADGFYYTPVYGGDNGVTFTCRLTSDNSI